MAWDFETDAGFQEKLDWMDSFVREEVEPAGVTVEFNGDAEFPPIEQGTEEALAMPVVAGDPIKRAYILHNIATVHRALGNVGQRDPGPPPCHGLPSEKFRQA